MIERTLVDSDIPILRKFYESSGYTYQFPDLHGPHIEAARVVVDDDGNVLMGAAAERLVQIYLWSAEMEPMMKFQVLRMLHASICAELKKLGYAEINCFLPPSIQKKFGKRLERSFGFFKNWVSWCQRL